MLNNLTNTKILWRLFFTFAIFSFAMLAWIQYHGLHIIDEVSDPEQVKAVLAAQTPAQHKAHFWMTLLLDIPYPFAYGLLFAGLALKFLGKWGKWLCIPALIAIPFDTIENIAQLFILKGNTDLLALKAIVTPIKLTSFIIALILAIVALGIAAKRQFTSKPSQF